MGRSVDYLSNALKVYYLSYEQYFENEDGQEIFDDYAFEVLFDNIKHEIKAKYKSFVVTDNFDGREVKIFLRNNIVEIGISEYCGLVSISIRNVNDEKIGLARNFINKIDKGILDILKQNGETLTKVGTFSNGEGVYERI